MNLTTYLSLVLSHSLCRVAGWKTSAVIVRICHATRSLCIKVRRFFWKHLLCRRSSHSFSVSIILNGRSSRRRLEREEDVSSFETFLPRWQHEGPGLPGPRRTCSCPEPLGVRGCVGSGQQRCGMMNCITKMHCASDLNHDWLIFELSTFRFQYYIYFFYCSRVWAERASAPQIVEVHVHMVDLRCPRSAWQFQTKIIFPAVNRVLNREHNSSVSHSHFILSLHMHCCRRGIWDKTRAIKKEK